MRNTIGSRHVVVVVVDLLLLLLPCMRMQWHRSSLPSSLSFFPVYYKIVFAFASVISMVGSRHVVVVVVGLFIAVAIAFFQTLDLFGPRAWLILLLSADERCN